MLLFAGICRRAIPRILDGFGLFIETSQPFFWGANEATVLNVRLAPRYLEDREDKEERVEASAVHYFPSPSARTALSCIGVLESIYLRAAPAQRRLFSVSARPQA